MSKRNPTYRTDIELHRDRCRLNPVSIYLAAAFAFVLGFFAGLGP
jgi:hypothetical protein